MTAPGTEQHAKEAEISDDIDIVAGILSYNNSATIGRAIKTVREGLLWCFPERRSLLVHADGGSHDGTRDLAREAIGGENSFLQIAYSLDTVRQLSPGYSGVPGKTSAISEICSVARDRKAAVCVVLDANVCSLTREWPGTLARPVLDNGFDLVSACYLRHKFDGAVYSGIVYPFTRALYGRRIQQPMGGEFAFSAKLVRYFLRQPRRDGDGLDSGFDIRATIEAVTGGFRVAQAYLGVHRLSDREQEPEVSSIVSQTLGAIFTEMDRTASVWQRVRGSESIPTFGACGEIGDEPAQVDIQPMIQSFRLGYENLRDIWRMVLPPATLMDLKKMSLQTAETFRFNDSLWARTLYDFALAWRMRTIDRDHLLKALTPLYLGWVASYIRAVRDADSKQTQASIETLCLAFEVEKSYLISRWRWPDRFNP